MAKLYFKYGPMKCGKTTDIIKTYYNYKEINMNVLIIISCICFLFICMRIFVVPIKLMVKLGINSILGIIFILIVNFIGIYFNFHIGINWITILIVRNFRSTRRNIYYIGKKFYIKNRGEWFSPSPLARV